jgi:hypothetical protein
MDRSFLDDVKFTKDVKLEAIVYQPEELEALNQKGATSKKLFRLIYFIVFVILCFLGGKYALEALLCKVSGVDHHVTAGQMIKNLKEEKANEEAYRKELYGN